MYLNTCVCTYDTYNTFIHKTTFIIHRNYDDDNAVVIEAVVLKNVVYGNRGGQSTEWLEVCEYFHKSIHFLLIIETLYYAYFIKHIMAKKSKQNNLLYDIIRLHIF